jgi:3-oxoacyl-[acyl-carrier protein] reductase
MNQAQNLGGKLALITGGTGGIGQATCKLLASRGCNIAIHYNRASSVAQELISSLSSAHHVRVQAFQADLSDYGQVRRLHQEVVSAMGDPHIVFLNAGIDGGKSGVKDISQVTIDEFEQTWRGNCGQAFLLAQLTIPAMVECEWGRLIFCSSVAGFTGGVVGPHYAYATSFKIYSHKHTASIQG